MMTEPCPLSLGTKQQRLPWHISHLITIANHEKHSAMVQEEADKPVGPNRSPHPAW